MKYFASLAMSVGLRLFGLTISVATKLKIKEPNPKAPTVIPLTRPIYLMEF